MMKSLNPYAIDWAPSSAFTAQSHCFDRDAASIVHLDSVGEAFTGPAGPQLVSSTLLATSARLTSLVDARPAALPAKDVERACDGDEGAVAQHEEELDETLLFHHNEEDAHTPREQARPSAP